MSASSHMAANGSGGDSLGVRQKAEWVQRQGPQGARRNLRSEVGSFCMTKCAHIIFRHHVFVIVKVGCCIFLQLLSRR